MARKKKDFPPKRERKVTVRFTMEAYEAIEKYASLAKVSVSEYIRNLALNKKPTITYETTFDSTELLKVLGDMGKIGSNLNQIARHLNEGGTLSETMKHEITESIKDIKDIRDDIRKQTGEYRGNTKA